MVPSQNSWVESTLATLALCVVVSYNAININKKLNLFALRQKIVFGVCQKKMEILLIIETCDS